MIASVPAPIRLAEIELAGRFQQEIYRGVEVFEEMFGAGVAQGFRG
ncbi:MAG: hypothetical protein H0X57_17330, partial [Rubrobacter sp.]|nr:hypothetical protein [Rubrobacter sp.]